jgi:clostripain
MAAPLIFGGPAGTVGADEPARRAAWTVMVYAAGDCDLEPETLDNVEEMMEMGSDDKLNIIVLLDRSPKGEPAEADAKDKDDDDAKDDDDEEEDENEGYTNRGIGNLGDWSGAKLLRVEEGHLHEVADWGDTNAGDPAVLQRFIRTAASRYPADRYALIVSDHGSGWTGVCYDDGSNDSLSLNEVMAALKGAERETGRLELLGFDACLMGNLEVSEALAPFARTLVASEELVPGAGWNYVPLIRSLKRHPESDGRALGEVIADSFRDYFSKADRASGHGVTLSVIDPAAMRGVEDAMGALSRALAAELQRGGVEAWNRVARARARTLQFGGEGDDSWLFDLVHLAEELRGQFPDSAVSKAADAVTRAARGAVLHNVRGKDRTHANGLSIFFPPDSKTLKGDDSNSYLALNVARQGLWLPFLAQFTTLAQGQEQKPALGELRADGALVDDERNVTIKCKLSDDAEQAALAIARKEGNRHVIIARESITSDDSNNLDQEFSGSCYTLTNGKQQVTCPILDWQDPDSDDSPSIAEVPVQIRRSGKKEWHDATLVFDVDTDADEIAGELVRVYTTSRSRIWELKLRPGDSIRPLQEVIDGSGNPKRVAAADAPIFVVKDPKDLGIGYAPLDPGSYELGFLASDLGGHLEHQFIDIKVK